MSGAWAWVWKYVLLCFSFKFWECVDRAYVRWKIVESVWGKIKWGWLKERSVRYRELKRSSLSECARCAGFGERGDQKVFGRSFMCELKAQEGSLVLSPRLQWRILNYSYPKSTRKSHNRTPSAPWFSKELKQLIRRKKPALQKSPRFRKLWPLENLLFWNETKQRQQ